MLAFAVAALAAAPPVAAQPAAAEPAAVEIATLERKWGEAFVGRNFDFIEGIIAPEFRLVGVMPDGTYDMTRRSEWMANARAFTHHGFTVETVDVNRAGDTAVASARGVWTVSRRAGEPARPIRFFVTDTWVRRGGQWQVIHRYSQRLEAPAAAAGAARP